MLSLFQLWRTGRMRRTTFRRCGGAESSPGPLEPAGVVNVALLPVLLFEDGFELSTANSLPILVTSHVLAYGEAGKARIILGLSEYEVVGMLLEHLNQGLLVRCSDGLRMATAVTVHIVADVHEVSHGMNVWPIWRRLLPLPGGDAADRPKAKLSFMRVPGDITFLCSLFLVLEAADGVLT